jgi:transposase-like protein
MTKERLPMSVYGTPGVRWSVGETYVKVASVWRHVYRAVGERGRVIDILVSARRDIAAARKFFVRVLAVQEDPEQVGQLARAI